MIVIDTSVVSELMRADPDPVVLAWAEASGPVHTTAITVAEVRYGIARLPAGRRRNRLATTAAALFADFDDAILAFDAVAARRYAQIVVGRERVGRPIATADAQIAAICAARSAVLATRNVADFTGTGIDVIDPWQ